MTKISFIGLGNMGMPMAKNLLKQGYDLMIFDLVPEAVKKLVEAGAKSANNFEQLCNHADVIITMLPAGEHVHSVCVGKDKLFATAKPGTLLIDSSTIAVEDARKLQQLAGEVNVAMIDAPVSGGTAAAEAGTLTFMVGGSEENFNRAKPILEKMGKAVFHAGASGNGQAAKICNNMLLGISMTAVAETMILGKKLGLDPQKMFDICSNASGQCWSLTTYCPYPNILPNVPANRDYAPGFASAMMLKDLRLSQNAAQAVGAATPLGAEATALYTLFANQGNAHIDFSGIIKMFDAGK